MDLRLESEAPVVLRYGGVRESGDLVLHGRHVAIETPFDDALRT